MRFLLVLCFVGFVAAFPLDNPNHEEKFFRDWVKKVDQINRDIFEKIDTQNERIQNYIDSYKELSIDDLVQFFQKYFEIMKENPELFKFEGPAFSSFWEKVKEKFNEFKELFKGKYQKLNEWLKEHIKEKKGWFEEKKNKYKDLAKEVLEHIKEVKGQVAREALELFELHKKEVGDIWTDLKKELKNILKGDE